ncbi:MAG: DUF1269 domain-containing protein [Ancalomicrobiaceae bacterium]|nr:DUF1269 domain-containing protein [Ancalomicrobiaceae bacterium]
MSQLFAIVYDYPDLAHRAADEIRELAHHQLLSLRDISMAKRSADGSVTLDHARDPAVGSALSDAFWAGLIGLVFLSPGVGAAGSWTAASRGGWIWDYGIDDGFVVTLERRLKPGRAAVLVLADDIVAAQVAPALGQVHGELIYSALTANVDAIVVAALAGASGHAGVRDFRMQVPTVT